MCTHWFKINLFFFVTPAKKPNKTHVLQVYIALLQRMPEKMLCDGCSSLADTLCCEFASWVSQVLLSRDVLMLATFALVATSVALAPRDADSVRVVCRALFSR